MATKILRSSEVGHVLGLFCILMLVHKGDAYEFIVGGQKGWTVPSDPNSNPYNQWAEKNRFQIGDSLVFNYQSGQDSVLQVDSDKDYSSCNTDASSAKFSDGHTVIKLSKSGPHYFISGNKNNCLKNEKLVVIVLADRSNRNSNTNQTGAASPSSSPKPSVTAAAPTPAPVVVSPPPSGVVGTPSPSQIESPPPPSGTGAGAPAPVQPESPPPAGATGTSAPSQQEVPSPPHNAASSILVSFVGYVGAFMASVAIVSF